MTPSYGLPHLDHHGHVLSFLLGFHPLLELAGVTRRHATKLGGKRERIQNTHTRMATERRRRAQSKEERDA